VSAPVRRPRVALRARLASERAPEPGDARQRMAAALACCTAAERLVLALMIEERLTATETARALDMPVAEVVRTHSVLLTELRRALGGRPFRRAARTEGRTQRLRRAS
jgi:DNA-directed RNA polymerase specialized sigma24 family protein